MSLKPIITKIDGIFTEETSLISQVLAAASSLTVKNISNFAINQILLIGELGAEDSEVVKTHASSAPSGSTVTLAAAVAFTHPVYTRIRVMLYDRIEISHSVTISGAKTLLTTTLGSGLVAITGQNAEVRWNDTEYNTGYYWVRYKNSIDGTFSDYAGPIPYEGFSDNTVGAVIKAAMKRCHLEEFTTFVDYDFCIDEINECLRFISGKLKKWSKLQQFGYVLGQTSRGVNRIALPSDIYEDENNKSIDQFRIGTVTLSFLPIHQWRDKVMSGVYQTQVTTEAIAGQTTLEIDNSYDFADSGSVNLYISGTLYTVTYTGVTRSATAGILTGVPASGDGAITVTIPVDTNVWQGEGETKPEFYTVFGGYIYHELPSATYQNLNAVLDYRTVPDSVNTDDDELDAFRYDAVKHWLIWAINAQIKNKGKRDMSDADYIQFLQTLSDYIRNEIPAHARKRRPRINGIFYNGGNIAPGSR